MLKWAKSSAAPDGLFIAMWPCFVRDANEGAEKG